VTAAPGSGKTYTMLHRANYLLKSVSPRQILILSFSTASVGEIKRRMELMSADTETNANLSKVTAQTAHSFALGLNKRKSVLSDKRAIKLLGQAIKAVQKDIKKSVLWPDVANSVKQRRLVHLDELLTPVQIKLVLRLLSVAWASRKKVSDSLTGQFESFSSYAKVLTAIRNKYSAIKKAKRVIDFGDMLVQAVTLIEGGASVPFTHILVDEYQDCSAAQTHLLAQLAKLDGRSLMVFGDSSQGIFGFAGADHTPLSTVLENIHPMSLPESWRLTAQTAALASAVAGLKGERAIQTKSKGEMPVLVCDDSLRKESSHIVQHILKLIREGARPQEIAVLARTKALLHPVEQMLLGKSVHTKRMGSKRYRIHALHVLKLVSIVERCEKTKREVMPEMLIKALPILKGVDDAVWKKQSQALNKVSRIPSLEGRYKQCAKIYLRLNGGVRANADLRADVNRWEAKCRDYQNGRSMRVAIRAMEAEGIVTGTIHASKGREWNHVLIVGATDGLLPIHFAKSEHSINQERNMLYVAITRARNTVRLYHAPSNYARGRKRFEDVSRFLDTSAVRKTMLRK